MIPKSILALKAAHPDKVSDISVEHGTHDGIWIYLKPGWCHAFMETHCVHEWTTRDVLREFKNVAPCKCEDCVAELKGEFLGPPERE